MSAQLSFAQFETSNGFKIYRIPLEVFPNFWAYAYLVNRHDDCILIDCGSGIDTSHEDLLQGFEQAGISPSDITHILLTHAHIDHYGGLTRLRPLTQAKIGCHALDLSTVSHHEADMVLGSRRFASFLADTGLAEETRDTLLSISRFSESFYQSVSVDFTYDSTDQIPSEFEIIHLPGHCAGHVAMRLDDVIFIGDMVVEGITPHLFPETMRPFNGLAHYLDSLQRLEIWSQGARLILNGHDDVITNLPERIDATRSNLNRRIGKALDALDEELTISETCDAVYGKMEGYNGLLIVEKTGAYIEYLYQHGMITIANADEVALGVPAKYRRVQDKEYALNQLSQRISKPV